MPLLFCLGQHRALEAAQRQLRDGERVGPACAVAQQELWIHAGIRVHTGKTKVWNRDSMRPVVCNVLERIAEQSGNCVDWFGHPSHQQGVKIFGTPLGHPNFVAAHL